MRKRAMRRFKPTIPTEEPTHIVEPKRPIFEKKPIKIKRNLWIPFILLSIFLLVLFFNAYFNIASDVSINPEGEGFEKYYLSGPDPYYNLRHVEGTYETGRYPYYSETDYLLNYPRGARGGRAPLFNMMALGFSRFLTPFMDEVDAIGRSMQFVPALFGALLIFPVYFIGKELFDKKAGLIAAMFVAIIPIHLGSGHGSAYSLFDHDSFNLLLFVLTFLFLIKSLKEKDSMKSTIYAILAGIPLAALSMTWVEARYLYVIIAVYAIVQMIIDIFTNKIEFKIFRTTSVIMLTGYLVSVPVIASKQGGFAFDLTFFLSIGIVAFGALYYFFGWKKLPWTISLPFVFSIAGAVFIFLALIDFIAEKLSFLFPIKRLADILFGTGIYGNKVSMTIAEANTYQISHTVMSFGPALYWLGWAGFVLLLWYYYRNKFRREYLFIIVLFIVNLWLAGTAGRFLNDSVPLIAILGGWVVWFIISKIDYKQMIRNIKSAGGGFHGIRRGVKFLHIFGILFLSFLVVLPNAFVAFDAAIPNKAYPENENKTEWSNWKVDYFGEEYSGAFGLGTGKESYWVDALTWLNEQDVYDENNNTLEDTEKPAFISWWDYGFYEVAIGGHPTVADNFQDGIPPAANFHTATSEQEGVVIWLVRLLEGDREDNGGKLSDEVKNILEKYAGNESKDKITKWMETLREAPSYGHPIGLEYDDELGHDYIVGQQYPDNAVYHDIVDLLVKNTTTKLSDDEITWLYHEIQNATGYSIRYYGVEGYDKQIFNIFAFLSDKSLLLVGAPEDDFIVMLFSGAEYDANGNVVESYTNEPFSKYLELTNEQKRRTAVTGTSQAYKDPYFETMFYRTYLGTYENNQQGNKIPLSTKNLQIPCFNMKHFYAEFMSDMAVYQYYNTVKAAVVIAKYYEGAYINGTVLFNGQPIGSNVSVAVLKNLTYSVDPDYPISTVPIEHDKYDIRFLTNPEAKFNLIAGAGSRLQIRKTIGQSYIIIKNVTFKDPDNSDFSPITEEDAMRLSNNYERNLTITIEPSSIEGHIFNDIDYNGVFNSTIDEPVEDIVVRITEVTGITEDQQIEPGNQIILSEIEDGYYNASGLLPGYYRLEARYPDASFLALEDIVLYEGNNSYDIIEPNPSNIEGIVYYDDDLDGKYDSGEEISSATIKLYRENTLVNETTTNSEGYYSFESLIPGWKIGESEVNKYVIEASKSPEYQSILNILPEENKTTTFNISIKLVPVTVTGQTTQHAGQPVDGAEMVFEKDETVTRNTAVDNSATTDTNGQYSASLQPGSYNVSIAKFDGETLVYQLEDEKLVLTKGQAPKTENYILIKKSVTVTGTAKHNNENIANLTITFEPEDIVNASLKIVTTTETGYTVELTPGAYDIFAGVQEFNIDGINYTYSISNDTNQTTVTEEDIATGKVFNIKLERHMKDE